MSAISTSNRNGETRSVETCFDKAPASKFTHGELIFSLVKQTTPKIAFSRFLEIVSSPLAPLEISFSDINISRPGRTFDKKSFRIRAVFFDRICDQLRNKMGSSPLTTASSHVSSTGFRVAYLSRELMRGRCVFLSSAAG